MIRRRVLAALAATVLTLVPALAPAHSLLVRSQPAQRATVTRPPERVQMWFSERLEPAYASASVWNEAGKQVDGGDAKVDASDPSLLSVSTPNLGPGRYTVRYRVLSVDGHVVESSYTFTVGTAAR
ncbi:MAG TPA: copper resistance CopC family protein [Methylomirabilota bacterium]|jgi:methionine-rich copper-binding protein CopC|nr:copper resistance CopC family protein [Methylomirabilota bacterium]